MNEPVKVDVKQAVNAALSFVQGMYGEAIGRVTLEEVERGDDGYWEVTLTLLRSPDALESLRGKAGEKMVKLFRVDQTGQVVAMRNAKAERQPD